MTGPAEVLDSAQRAPRPPLRRRAAAGAVAGLVVAAGALVVVARDDGAPGADVVSLDLVGHTGLALTGQQFVRFSFDVSASGGDADLESVEMALGSRRQAVLAPPRIDAGSSAAVVVDVVPACPDAVLELAGATLDVTYRSGGGAQVARLPLPVEGPLPRLVQRRCAELDRV